MIIMKIQYEIVYKDNDLYKSILDFHNKHNSKRYIVSFTKSKSKQSDEWNELIEIHF